MLLAAAAVSKNAALEKAIAAFTGLAPAMRKALIASIEIIDSAPLITDLETVIEDRLRMIAPRGKASLAREQLEGLVVAPHLCCASGGKAGYNLRA